MEAFAISSPREVLVPGSLLPEESVCAMEVMFESSKLTPSILMV